ncbi:MAG: MoxR family ATPase [Mesorhizobium sp.]|uniref:hypothetical protein n=1 Tax=Mesorhizobium sp. TaxID=1871066 RepID=UPI000FE5CD0A|nr:hypothetical protein [Mesorhizobium sp.]RWC91703.1 MAG: MoxR family ATPase [Mesorhizobium sp.]
MNLITARAVVESYLDADIPVFKWSPPGVGKSSLIKQITRDRGWGLVDFRCSTRDPVALMGIPSAETETTRWKVPDEFPQVERDGKEGILFLDELNTAAPSMQAAAFGLVLDRKVGEYTVPAGWRVVGAGNRQSDRAAAQRMPTALANRFAHVDIDPDVDTTTRYFNERGIDPMMIAFLRFRPGMLHMMEGSDLRAFPTPRSWEQAAKVIKKDNRLHMITGLVGEGAAAEFEGFIRVYSTLPSLDQVIAHPETTVVPTEPAARFAIAAGLARKAKKDNFAAIMTYIRRLPREFEVMMTVDAVRRDGDLGKTQAFIDWSVRNQDVTLA